VVASQVVTGTCQIVCNPAGAVCDDLTIPQGWEVPDGHYHIWYRGKWVNVLDGREVVTHPAELVPQEDGRRFIYLETVTIGLDKVYLPIIKKRCS
jgi:hypothetical protein